MVKILTKKQFRAAKKREAKKKARNEKANTMAELSVKLAQSNYTDHQHRPRANNWRGGLSAFNLMAERNRLKNIKLNRAKKKAKRRAG